MGIFRDNRFTRLADRVDALLARIEAPAEPMQLDQSAEIQQLTNNYSQLRKAHDDLLVFLDDEKQAHNDTISERDHLKAVNQQLVEDNAILKADRREFEVANNSLKVINKKLETENQKLLGDVDLVSRRNIDNSVTIESFQAKIAELSRLNMNLTGQKHHAEGERDKLKRELDKLKREALEHCTEKMKLTAAKDAACSELSKITNQRDIWQREVHRLAKRIDKLKQEAKKPAKPVEPVKKNQVATPTKPASKKPARKRVKTM